MYIAVICGGLSAERDVSISSGTGAARALRARGHKVALVDLFLGNPSAVKDPRSVFTSDAGDSVYSVRETEPDLDKIRAQRGGKGLIGPGVIEICRAARRAKTGSCRHVWIFTVCRIPAAAISAARSPWIRN